MVKLTVNLTQKVFQFNSKIKWGKDTGEKPYEGLSGAL